MSQQQKAAYFRALKAAGIPFEKHYREYTEAELKQAYDALAEGQRQQAKPQDEFTDLLPPAPSVAVPPVQPTLNDQADRAQQLRELERQRQELLNTPEHVGHAFDPPSVPQREADPNELPGMRLNSHKEDEPIRVDEQGLIWYQEEVLKPGYAKPRGRRVLQYTDRGSVTKQVQNGDYIESFEVDGAGPGRTAEIKITLPSYQTGIYKDPRFPFKIHIYNGNRGFDFAEVAEYYNGVDLVPQSIKRIYVENVLCYDMRSTIQAIQAEFRQMQLTGRIR